VIALKSLSMRVRFKKVDFRLIFGFLTFVLIKAGLLNHINWLLFLLYAFVIALASDYPMVTSFVEGAKNEDLKKIREKEFLEIINGYCNDDVVKKMDEFFQHGNTTTLGHAVNVSWVCFLINEKLNLKADEKELIEAALLHDFYLYDWHTQNPYGKLHGFIHPEIASENAKKYFNISKKQQEAIKSHMWPLNIIKVPKSKEAFILCMADKYCAVAESLRLNKLFGLRH